MNRFKKFMSFVIPSVLAFALSGIYAIVDGFFVGNSVGDVGLSTINISYPIVSLLQAVGTGIGMGGGILYTVHLANGKKESAKNDLFSTFIFLIGSSLIITMICYFFVEDILRLLGAKGEILAMGKSYLGIIIIGGAFQILGTGIVPLVRNRGGSLFAMMSMIAGFATNIVLDFLFVWVLEKGVSGAALATVIGQAVTVICGVIYFYINKISLLGYPTEKLFGKLISIFKIGVAPFGITISPILSLIFMNRYSLYYGGENAIAGYACISYALTIIYLLLQGVGDGSQPLMSEEFGKGDIEHVNVYRKYAYLSGFIIATFSIILMYTIRFKVGSIFGASQDVVSLVGEVIPLFLIGIGFLAFARVTTSSFYATEKNLYSYIVVYAEPVIAVILLLILPRMWGQTGVWLAMPFSQIITAFIAYILKISVDKSRARNQKNVKLEVVTDS